MSRVRASCANVYVELVKRRNKGMREVYRAKGSPGIDFAKCKRRVSRILLCHVLRRRAAAERQRADHAERTMRKRCRIVSDECDNAVPGQTGAVTVADVAVSSVPKVIAVTAKVVNDERTSHEANVKVMSELSDCAIADLHFAL